MRLICSAWQEELKYIEPRDRHGAARLAMTRDAALAMTGDQPRSCEATPMLAALGIGYLEAALELTRILEQHSDIDEIVFLGTCGSYNHDLNIGDVVSVSSVRLLERGTVLGLAYSVGTPSRYEANGDCFAALAMTGDAAVDCLCSLEITNSSELSAQILKHYGFERAVENMELYGVARVASERGIKWSAHLGVTNYTDLNAHRDWQANHQSLSQQLAISIANKYSCNNQQPC